MIIEPTNSGLSIAIRAALEAGRRIMQIYDYPAQSLVIERKADN